jgi:hypothetical protein
MADRKLCSEGVNHLLALRETAVKTLPLASDKENVDPNARQEEYPRKAAVRLVRRKRQSRPSDNAAAGAGGGGEPARAEQAPDVSAAAACSKRSCPDRNEKAPNGERLLPAPLDELGRRVNLRLRSRTAVVSRQPDVKSALRYTF